MATKRAKAPVTGPGAQAHIRFNENANSDKVSETGFDFTGGILGPINTAVLCGANKPVMVCNTDTVVRFVLFGDNTVAAPTGLSDGIMIPPQTCMMLSSGTNTHIRSSSANVGAYVAVENVSDGASQGNA
jgi:hypothetical protein